MINIIRFGGKAMRKFEINGNLDNEVYGLKNYSLFCAHCM